MSATLNLQAGGDGAEGITEYRVVVRGGCTLIFGSVPVDHFAALSKAAPPKSVLSPQLAKLAGANTAFGLPQDCKALETMLREDKLRANPSLDNLGRWLLVGERGASSEAIVAHLRGVPKARNGGYYPHDADDLQRCMKLLIEVPELVPDFPRMREVSPQWAALVDNWEALCRSLISEAGLNWREGNWRAPTTSAWMRRLIEGASK
jgi:hypothetical protein